MLLKVLFLFNGDLGFIMKDPCMIPVMSWGIYWTFQEVF